MIIKTISRKSNVDQLIRYVLTDEKLAPIKEPSKRPIYIPGVILTKEDIKHLESEKMDAALLAELKAFKGTIKEFIDHCISKNVTTEKQNKIEPIVIKNNIRARSVNGYIREFEANEKFRLHTRKDSVLAFHTIISFSALDSKHLGAKVLKDIAQKYISLRAEQSLVVGAVHRDRENTIHMHLVQSGVQYCTGVSNRISRQEFHELKVAMQEYQKERYPQLVHSMPEHGKSKNGITKEDGSEKNIKSERSLDKHILLGLLETTYATSTSKEHFLAQLQDQGHVPYFRNGRFQGVKFDGERKFRINRLGYDEKKLQELDMKKEMQEKSLAELRGLRTGRTKAVGKNKNPEVRTLPENEVLYHGTAKGNYFDKFDLSRENRGIGSNAFHQGKNIYLTDREDAAAYFSKQATENYQLWKCIFDKTDPINIKSEIGEVYKVRLTKNTNMKVLDHRPDKEEIEKLKADGYDAVKFKDIAFEAVEGSMEVFDMLKKGVPNTIVVFDSEKVAILENNKPKGLVQEKPLLKELPFEEVIQANIDEKERARLQELVDRDTAFEAKNGIASENSPSNHEEAQLQELRDIRESRGKEMDRRDGLVQNDRDEGKDRNSDDGRNDTKDRDNKPEDDIEDEDSTGTNDDSQNDDDDTDVR